VTTIKADEPRVILTIEKYKVSLFINTRASISVIPFFPRPRSSKKINVPGIPSQSLDHYFNQPLAYPRGDFHFCHSFLIVGDLQSKLGVQLLLLPGVYFCLSVIGEQVGPMVWTDGHTVGQAQTAVPV
jgi:hypothetical protein